MSFADSIRQLLPPVDPRAPQQIERDIDDEFCFHLAMLEDAERAAGADADTAQAKARKRFGDAAKWRRRCRNIALKERVMLQRINFALTILLMLVVIGVGVQVYMTQRHNTLALQEITSQIGKMRYDAEAAEASSEPTGPRRPRAEADARSRELGKLLGVWQLDDDSGHLSSVARYLVLRATQSRRAGGTVDFHDSDTELRLSLAPNGYVGAQGSDRGDSISFPTELHGDWQLEGPDTLVLDLRELRAVEDRGRLSDELRSFLLVPVRYTRVTQALSKRNQDGPAHVAHVFGNVESPDEYELQSNERIALQALLKRAGLNQQQAGTVRVIMMSDDGPSPTLNYDLSELRDPSFPPVPLDPDSVVQVIADGGAKPADAQPVDSTKQLAPESSADEDARRPSDQLIGVWRLTEGHNHVPEQEHFLAIEPTNSFPATTIRRSGARGIKVSFIGADEVAMQGHDGWAVFSLINIDGGWRLESPDTLVLDLRPAFEHAYTDALQQFVKVPLIYTRVTQQLSIREEEGTRRAVHIFGDISSPGRYDLPKSGKLALQDLLAEAGGTKADRGTARIYMMNDKGETATLDYDLSELRDPSFPPVPLDPDSVVQVIAEDAGEDRRDENGATTQIDYDTRNLVGVWRAVDSEHLPKTMQILPVFDKGEPTVEGFVDQNIEPIATLQFDKEADTWMNLEFGRERMQAQPNVARLYTSIRSVRTEFSNTGRRKNVTAYGSRRLELDGGGWEPLSENRIALHLDDVLDSMTAETAEQFRPWFDEPVVYERVTAPYSQHIDEGPPPVVHVLGISAEPKQVEIPDGGELTAYDVIAQVGAAGYPAALVTVLDMDKLEPEFILEEVAVASLLHPATTRPMNLKPDSVVWVTNADLSEPAMPNTVFVHGHVELDGFFELPKNSAMKLSRLVARTKPSSRKSLHIEVREFVDGRWRRVESASWPAVQNLPERHDVELKPGQIIFVLNAPRRGPGYPGGGVVYTPGDDIGPDVVYLSNTEDLMLNDVLEPFFFVQTPGREISVSLKREMEDGTLQEVFRGNLVELQKGLVKDVLVQEYDVLTIE